MRKELQRPVSDRAESAWRGSAHPWKIVVMHLICKGVLWIDEDVFQETRLACRDVREPPVTLH